MSLDIQVIAHHVLPTLSSISYNMVLVYQDAIWDHSIIHQMLLVNHVHFLVNSVLLILQIVLLVDYLLIYFWWITNVFKIALMDILRILLQINAYHAKVLVWLVSIQLPLALLVTLMLQASFLIFMNSCTLVTPNALLIFHLCLIRFVFPVILHAKLVALYLQLLVPHVNHIWNLILFNRPVLNFVIKELKFITRKPFLVTLVMPNVKHVLKLLKHVLPVMILWFWTQILHAKHLVIIKAKLLWAIFANHVSFPALNASNQQLIVQNALVAFTFIIQPVFSIVLLNLK